MIRSSEEDLVRRCRGGEDEAFRELIDRYKTLIFGLISRSVANRARAEELAQDVFLRVHRGLPYFRGEARLSTWMYRIVANVLAEERQASHRARVSYSIDDRTDDGEARIEPASIDHAYGAWNCEIS